MVFIILDYSLSITNVHKIFKTMSIVIEPEAIEFAQSKLKDIIQNFKNPYFKSIHIDDLTFSDYNLQLLSIQDPKDQWYALKQQRHRYDTNISCKCTTTIAIKGDFSLSYDYPSNVPFLALPIHLDICVELSIIIYLIYVDDSFKLSIRGISNLETGLDTIIKSCQVTSEIGDTNKLINLKSIESFIHVLLEEGLKKELGYPNYYEFKY